jgi:hypothetical protein
MCLLSNPTELDQDWIFQDNFMITFPRCVDFFPFTRTNLYGLPRANVFTSKSEIFTNKNSVCTLTNGIGLTQFGGM